MGGRFLFLRGFQAFLHIFEHEPAFFLGSFSDICMYIFTSSTFSSSFLSMVLA